VLPKFNFIAVGVCAVVLSVVLKFGTPSPLVAGLIVFATLLTGCVPLVYAVSASFQGFDLSQEVPE
jgi:hypothetical protein